MNTCTTQDMKSEIHFIIKMIIMIEYKGNERVAKNGSEYLNDLLDLGKIVLSITEKPFL